MKEVGKIEFYLPIICQPQILELFTRSQFELDSEVGQTY